MNDKLLTLLASSLVALTGCGGGGDRASDGAGPPTMPPTVPPPGAITRAIGGLWFGGLHWSAAAPHPAGSTSARILVAETGEFRIVMTGDPDWEMGTLFSNESEQISGHFGYSGVDVVTLGDSVATMPLSGGNPTGGYVGSFAMSGRFESRTNFAGTFASMYTSFLERTGTIAFTYHSLYEQPSSLTLLAGTFTTANSSLSIDSQGVIFFQSAVAGCIGNGRAEVIDPRYNMYRLSITVETCAGIDAARNGLTFTGLANIGVNNDYSGALLNQTLEMALSAASGVAGHIHWNHLGHRQ